MKPRSVLRSSSSIAFAPLTDCVRSFPNLPSSATRSIQRLIHAGYAEYVVAYDFNLADRVRSILGRTNEFSEKNMFGGITFMLNGRMCCGVVNRDLVLRLTPDCAAALLREPHTRPMDFTGRPMKSMIYVSAIGTDSDGALERWIETAVKVARSLSAERIADQETRAKSLATAINSRKRLPS